MTRYGILLLDGNQAKLVDCSLYLLHSYPPPLPQGHVRPHPNGLVVSWDGDIPTTIAGFTAHPDRLMVLGWPRDDQGRVAVARPLDHAAARYLPADKFPVTDRAVGLAPGTLYSTSGPGKRPSALFLYGDGLGPLSGLEPDIDQNPFNWVGLEGAEPSLFDGPHSGHDRYWQQQDRLSGYLDCSLQALTALFVPAGFPFRPSSDHTQQPNAAQLQNQSRHFLRLRRASGETHYAIPGATLKGMLRSAVEAVTNSRFGAVDRAEFALPLPFRCTAFDAGFIRSMPTEHNDGEIEPVSVYFLDNAIWQHLLPSIKEHVARGLPGLPANFPPAIFPLAKNHCRPALRTDSPDELCDIRDPDFSVSLMRFEGHLLGARVNRPDFEFILVQRKVNPPVLRWSHDILQAYDRLIGSPHYKNHWDASVEGIYPDLDDHNYNQGLTLDSGKLVWFTIQGRVAVHNPPPPPLLLEPDLSSFRLRTIGRNVRHLWPAEVDRGSLYSPWYPLGETSANLQSTRLSVAEQIFGFSATHRPNGASHPFLSLIQPETAWSVVPALSCQQERAQPNPRVHYLTLAALTSPATPGKSRPLYLEPGHPNAGSKDFRKRDHCRGRGRKFYWHQNDPSQPTRVWKAHQRSHDHVASQCPPPLYALAPGERFQVRLWFRNLSPLHLGALLAVLEGAGPGHALKLGKARARGLGSVRLQVDSVRLLNPTIWYSSEWLPDDGVVGPPAPQATPAAWTLATSQDLTSWRQAFEDRFPAILVSRQEFNVLHQFPGEHIERLRLYPIRFNQYSWNYMAGDPWADTNARPKALSSARDIAARDAL